MTPANDRSESTDSPVQTLPTDPETDRAEDGVALCLSGGGYRAMLFHAGVLWRLNEFGWLPRLARISSVSGGSITAAMLGLSWSRLRFDRNGVAAAFDALVVQPIRALADHTIDAPDIVKGILMPGSVADHVAKSYDAHLFHHATLQDLPDAPRFIFNATNVQSGALWRFSKPYMRDWRVGEVKDPTLALADAVGASAACPPFLSPMRLQLREDSFTPNSGADLQRPPFTTEVCLTDGGVYDNLGLETAWKRYRTILVSDGGVKMAAEERPHGDWARHAVRVNDLIDNQVRSLRKRQVIRSFQRGIRSGTYWGIRTPIAAYGLKNTLPCPLDATLDLAATPTRLKRLEPERQEQLVNWGYALCDAAMRAHVDASLPAAQKFPYTVGVLANA